ncbi:MAG: helicase-associated domain-containing protein, partial [Candidatus Phosphoribacter sp.]
ASERVAVRDEADALQIGTVDRRGGGRDDRAEACVPQHLLPAGSAPTPESVGEAIAWRRPLGDDQSIAVGVAAVMQQAEWLGLTGLGALTSVGGALAEGADPDTLRSAADALLPAAVDHVLLQADLTAIAPGPLDGPLGRLMRLVSDVESRGGATVLRFSAPTVRRALDAGMTADDILGQLAAASRTPIPQPLDYLVRDIARRHGQTRVGGATAYVRSDDEAVLAALVADRSLSSELLRRIAPTVVVSQADPVTLLEKLRAAGYAPAREALDGSLVVSAPQGRRARDSRRRPAARGIPDPTLRLVDLEFARSVVAALRCAPPRPAASSTPSGPLSNPPGESANLLRHAIADAFPVWVGYADGNGRTARHLVRPVRIEGGRVYAVSGESDAEQVFLLHRITGAQPG